MDETETMCSIRSGSDRILNTCALKCCDKQKYAIIILRASVSWLWGTRDHDERVAAIANIYVIYHFNI